MKILELAESQLEFLADRRPEWMAYNRTAWMADHRPEWMAYNRTAWMAAHRTAWMANEVPADIAELLAEESRRKLAAEAAGGK